MNAAEPGSLKTIGEKVNWLFRTHLSPGGKEYTATEVAEALTNQYGCPMSVVAMWRIRKGQVQSPKIEILEGLSRFFHVPLTFFASQPISPEEQQRLAEAHAIQASGTSDIALRAGKLTPLGRDAVRAMIEQIAKMEGIHDLATTPRPDSDPADPE